MRRRPASRRTDAPLHSLVESSWRWIFLISVPETAVRGRQQPGWRIDSVGTLLVLAAVGLVARR
jgi:hypothetical protein